MKYLSSVALVVVVMMVSGPAMASDWWSFKVGPSGVWIDDDGDLFIWPDQGPPASLDNASGCSDAYVGILNTNPHVPLPRSVAV